jgi:protein-S-isoprenylcysteine O-methyltransferase Ste14
MLSRNESSASNAVRQGTLPERQPLGKKPRPIAGPRGGHSGGPIPDLDNRRGQSYHGVRERLDTSMKREISIFGVGPIILGSAIAYAAVAGAATRLWPDICVIRAVPRWALVTLGILFLLVGLPMLAVGARAMAMAYRSDRLATTGLFGIVRNPIYAAWIVFVIPGLVLFTQSWPLLLTPVVAYVAFKIKIPRENRYLEKRFGAAYRQYKADVNELFPFPRLGRRRN